MDDKVIKQIQREGADALLDVGVSVPLKAIRIPFRKNPVELRVTMKRPYLSGQIRFARTYLSMGVTSEQMWNMDKEEEMTFIAEHGEELSRMIAYTICRGWWSRHLLLWPTAWFVRNMMEASYITGAIKRFVSLMGTDPFIPIIRSAEKTNPMTLRLSQKKKGS
jgi:hypothetical protein